MSVPIYRTAGGSAGRTFGSVRPVAFLTFTVAVSSFGLLGSLMSTMLLFLGKVGPDVTLLLAMQALGFPVVLLSIFAYWLQQSPLGFSLREFWGLTPNWLVAALAVLLGTAACGQIALIIVKLALNRPVTLIHYLPILSVAAYSVAWVIGYVLRVRARSPIGGS